MSCQQCCGIRQEFNSKEGQKELKRFRRSGPDKTTMILIDLLRRAIQESGHSRLTLLDIGAGPHTEEMLVAYLPNEKIVFQGDLLNRPSNGDVPLANDTTVHFAKWLETRKLNVERILGVHGSVSTVEELKAAVAAKQSAKK